MPGLPLGRGLPCACPCPCPVPVPGRVGPPRVGQLAPRFLESRRRTRQVAVGRHLPLGAGQRLTEAIERALGALRVALGQALGRVVERRRGRPVRAGRGGLLFGQLSRQVRALFGGHLVELLSELVEVLLGLLGIAVLVRVGLAGGRSRERAAERGHGRGPLLRRRVDLSANGSLDGAQSSEVDVQLIGSIAQLAGEVAQVLRQPGPRVLGVGTLRLEFAGEVVEPLGLLVRRFADLSLLCDRRVLRVRYEQDRREQECGDDRRDRRLP